MRLTGGTFQSVRSSATAAHLYSDLDIENILSRADRPHNTGITSLLFTIDVCVCVLLSPMIEVRKAGLRFNVLIL